MVFAIRGNALGLAAVYAAEGEHERAAQLLGAEARMREQVGWELDPIETKVLDRTVAGAHAALGDDAYAAAFARGQAITVDEVVELCGEAPSDGSTDEDRTGSSVSA